MVIDFAADGAAPPSVECRWGRDRMAFALVSAAHAPVGAYYVVEASWSVGGVEEVRHLQVHAENGGRALERCVRSLVRVVGGLDIQWATGPGL